MVELEQYKLIDPPRESVVDVDVDVVEHPMNVHRVNMYDDEDELESDCLVEYCLDMYSALSIFLPNLSLRLSKDLLVSTNVLF